MQYRYLKLLIVLLVVVILSLTFVACNDKDEVDPTIDPPIDLEMGKISDSLIYEFGISWRVVEDADYYVVSIYDENSSCLKEDTIYKTLDIVIYSYDFSNYIQHESLYITVIAFNNDGRYSNLGEYFWYKETSEEKENFVEGPNYSAGEVDGIEDKNYYYVNFSNTIYLLSTTNLDYAIVYNANVLVKRLIANGLSNEDYELDEENKLIILKKSYIDNFSNGAIIPIDIEYEDNSRVTINIFVVDIVPPALNTYKISFTSGDTNSASDKKIIISDEIKAIRLQELVFDGKVLSSDAYDIITAKQIKLKASYFSYVNPGDHQLKIYLKKDGEQIGFASVLITINNKNQVPNNVIVDFDSSFPNIFIKWNSYMDYDEAIVNIGSTSYSSKNNEFLELFEKNQFNATNKIVSQNTDVSISLVKDNVTYTSYTTKLSEDLDDLILKSYLSQTFEYLGNKFNLYIQNSNELDEFIGYNINHYKDSDVYTGNLSNYEETYKIYSPYLINYAKTYNSSKTIEENLSKIIGQAVDRYFDPINFNVDSSSIEVMGNEITFKLWLKTGSNRPYITPNVYEKTTRYKEYKNSVLHYYIGNENLISTYKHTSSTRGEDFDNFKINNSKKSAVVTTSSELLLSLEKGLLPMPVKNSNAERIYNKAKEILKNIIDDDMTDYQKVLAIYDWVIYNTIYDYGLEELMNNLLKSKDYESYWVEFKHPSFFAEGVFDYGVAVCTGIANAFSILANIEGIKCVRVTGETSGSHAWVKVNVDGEWYVCDPTWGNAKDLTNNQYVEYITYDYFMFSSNGVIGKVDNRTENVGIEANNYFAGEDRYNFFASQSFVIKNKLIDFVIEDYDEFNYLISNLTDYNDYYTIDIGDEMQFSIRANYKDVENWLNQILSNSYILARYEITTFARTKKSSNGSINVLSNYVNTTYIRIKRVG